jgi:hypothetical protein
MSEVRRADPAARRNAVLFVILGALVLPDSTPRMGSIGASKIRASSQARVSSVGCSLVGATGRLRCLFLSLGAQALRAQQFPPPGYRVIRDTLDLSGDGVGIARTDSESDPMS